MPNIAAWLAAANPLRENPTREQALMAGRWSSLALGLTALTGLIQGLLIWVNRDRTIAAMQEFMDGFTSSMGPDAAPEAVEMQSAMMEAMMPGMILQSVVWIIVFAIVFVALAGVQWSKPTRWIPIVFIVVAALGLFGHLMNMMMAATLANAPIVMADGTSLPTPGPQMSGIPAWFFPVMAAEAAIALVLHITGLRGAIALRRMAERAGGDVQP